MKTSVILMQVVAATIAMGFGIYAIFYMWDTHPGASLFLLFGIFLIASLIHRLQREKHLGGIDIKLPIRDEYFKKIKKGEKFYEYRDAHLNFVNEDTGEILFKYVTDVRLIPKEKLPEDLKKTDMYTDDWIIRFELSKTKYLLRDPYLNLIEAVGMFDVIQVIYSCKSEDVLKKITKICNKRIKELHVKEGEQDAR